MTTLRDNGTDAVITTPTPWDTPDVGNTEDALAAAKRLTDLAKQQESAKADRDAAIRRLRDEDGMSGPQIATLIGMSTRAVQFILSGTPRSDRP